MKLTLAEPKYLKDSVSIISDLVNEARFTFKPDGIELVAMDPANVAMVMYNLSSAAFVDYEVDEEMEIGINLNNLKQILRRASPTDVLSIEVTSENKLQVRLKGNTVRTFSLPIMDMDEGDRRIPDLEFPLSITLPSALLNQAVEDVDVVAESVTLQAEPDRLVVLAEGDLSKARVDIAAEDDVKIILEADQSIKAKYSIEYLKKMIPASKLAAKATMRFNKDYPLRLEYSAKDKLQMNFILAPRVDND